MSVVAPILFALGHRGVTFGGKLLDENSLTRNITGFTELQVIITKPDGTEIIKSSITDGVVPALPLQLNDTDIIWVDTGDSILDQRGPWHFNVASRFSADSFIPSYEKIGFWVV